MISKIKILSRSFLKMFLSEFELDWEGYFARNRLSVGIIGRGENGFADFSESGFVESAIASLQKPSVLHAAFGIDPYGNDHAAVFAFLSCNSGIILRSDEVFYPSGLPRRLRGGNKNPSSNARSVLRTRVCARDLLIFLLQDFFFGFLNGNWRRERSVTLFGERPGFRGLKASMTSLIDCR